MLKSELLAQNMRFKKIITAQNNVNAGQQHEIRDLKEDVQRLITDRNNLQQELNSTKTAFDKSFSELYREKEIVKARLEAQGAKITRIIELENRVKNYRESGDNQAKTIAQYRDAMQMLKGSQAQETAHMKKEMAVVHEQYDQLRATHNYLLEQFDKNNEDYERKMANKQNMCDQLLERINGLVSLIGLAGKSL